MTKEATKAIEGAGAAAAGNIIVVPPGANKTKKGKTAASFRRANATACKAELDSADADGAMPRSGRNVMLVICGFVPSAPRALDTHVGNVCPVAPLVPRS